MSTTTCPTWCKYGPSHSYYDEDQASRYHEGDLHELVVACDPALDSTDLVKVRVGFIVVERVQLGPDGVQVESTDPAVQVWLEEAHGPNGVGASLTADQALTLAAALVEAAVGLPVR